MSAAGPVTIAVVGAGLIGRRHIAHVAQQAALAAVVDPDPAAAALATHYGAPWFPDIAAMLAALRPEAAIVATPNTLHMAHGLALIAAGIPTLVEKPLASDVPSAIRLVDAADQAGVPLLTGHHRRHNPLVAAAKAAIDAGRIGDIVAVHAMCWFHKPADYFHAAWRTQPGAGPVLLNLIHDVDLLRHFCGPVVQVQAIESAARRNLAVEDTAAILLRFASGALGTLSVSDTIAAPWSWELTSGENPDFPHTGQSAYLIGGTQGSLTVPDLAVWAHDGPPGWMAPITRSPLDTANDNPLARQVRNLADVARFRAAPVASGREGLESLRVIAAIKSAAASGTPVHLP